MTLASEAGYGTRLLTVGDTIVTHRNGLEHGAPAPIAAPAARSSRQAIPHHPFDARRWSREHWVLASVFGTLGVLVMAIVPGFSQATRSQPERPALTTTELALPPLRAPVAADPGEAWQVVRVESGQTLGAIFSQHGFSSSLMHRMLEQPGAREPLTLLRPGAELAFLVDDGGALRALRFDKDEGSRQVLRVDGDQIALETIDRPVERRQQVASGRISSSLFAAGSEAGLSNATLFEMANVFSYDIDFSREVQEGDTFHVVYDEVWREGQRLRNGGIVAASFTNNGKRYTAFRFERPDGRIEYFDIDGRPLKKGFMRMPIEFARISSRFNPNRRHPVLGTIRAHRGVDYAARTGTPIMAAGDARVSFVGWQNGYGRTVILDHGNGITTLYAHMSRFAGFRVGQRVSQGQTIGYVGATGLASGPHLHYEFRVRGQHRDPLTVTMPPPEPLGGDEMLAFRRQTGPAMAQLQLIEAQDRALASAAR